MRYVGLIRGINVGGHGRKRMEDLRSSLTAAGFEEVKTILQSGSFVFDATGTADDLERRAEEALGSMGLTTAVMVRTADEWRQIVSQNPLPVSNPSRTFLYVGKREIPSERLEALQERFPGGETLAVRGREVYVEVPTGLSSSALLTSSGWTRATAESTARNWNTVRKILEAL